jgi:hypothetical protein
MPSSTSDPFALLGAMIDDRRKTIADRNLATKIYLHSWFSMLLLEFNFAGLPLLQS